MAFIILFFLAAALFVAKEPILLAVGDFLIVQDKLQTADIIHVIAGRDHRADYGIQLYKQGYSKMLFFTGGWCERVNEYHGRRAKRRALAQGVPIKAVAIDDSPVKSTYGEVVRLRKFISENRLTIRSIIVISDPHHMRRARWTYRKLFGSQISVRMTPVPFSLTPYRHRWWTDAKSQSMVIHEYMKIVYYYARYGLGWKVLSEWLATFDTK